MFAGRDATIGLATFNMAKMKKETSGESILSEKHQRNVRHWEKLFGGRFIARQSNCERRLVENRLLV